jgi:mono/diheme cytochrome c family protein
MHPATKVWLAVLLGAPAAAYGLLVFGGFAPVAADAPHASFVAWSLETARRSAVRREARAITPPDLRAPAAVKLGAGHYDEMCAGCHAKPGAAADEELVKGLSPAPPELARLVARRTAAELYWVTKHGVRMTGMPAWGPSHSEDELWALVAFLQALPTLSPAAYQALLAEAPAGAAAPAAGAPAAHDHDQGHAHAHTPAK